MRVTKVLSIVLALVALAAVAASPAAARSKDRNHDGIPDRWERSNKLSLSVNQARRDQDRDGLKNRGEFRAGTNPHDADTDNDGIDDADENAGTIASFENGVLTITLAGGGTLTGKVTDATEIKCPATTTASASHHGNDGPGEGTEGAEDNSGPSSNSGPGNNNGEAEDGEHGDCHHGDGAGQQNCTAAALTIGARVVEAELKTVAGEAVFEEIKLGS